MPLKTEYRKIAFLSGPRIPGGLPHAVDTSKGGSILRLTADGRDDVHIRLPNGLAWECPWTSVFWAVPGTAAVPKPKPERVLPSRVRTTPPVRPQPSEDQVASEQDADDEGDEPKTSTRPKPQGDWTPPRKPSAKKLARTAPAPVEPPAEEPAEP